MLENPKRIIGRAISWALFLFGEYFLISMAVVRVNAIWTYYQLLIFIPAIVVAYWALRPKMRKSSTRGLNRRLLIGAGLLVATAILIFIGTSIVMQIHNAKGPFTGK